MVIARFEFKPEHAEAFITNGSAKRNVIEVAFDSVESLIAAVKEFEECLIDVTAIVNDKIITLSHFVV